MSSEVEPPPGEGPNDFGPNDYVAVPRFRRQLVSGTTVFPESYYKALDTNDSVEIREDRHGRLGLFAKRDIQRGEVVGIYYAMVEVDNGSLNPYTYGPFPRPARVRCAVADRRRPAQVGRPGRQGVLSPGCARKASGPDAADERKLY